LAVLFLLVALNSMDRLAVGLVLQSIKSDLHLSDAQLGLLTGMAFALFYSVMGIPIARWADRGNRIAIISLATFLWAVALALSGLARSFQQLLLIRVGVAVGEAGVVPPAHSLIPDYFARAERPRAVSVFMLGGAFGVLLGYFVAGWLNQFYGWRETFVLIGLPGVVLAAVTWFTLEEPRRGSTRAVASVPAGRAVRELWHNRTYRHLTLSFALICFFGSGVLQWQPTFFLRTYGLDTGELGTWLALLHGVGGMLGSYLGGALASRFAAGDERRQLALAAVTYSCFAALAASIYLTPSRNLAFALTGASAVGAALITAPVFATIQTLVPERMRAFSIALIYLCANLVGLGLGPLVVGFLSDALRPLYGESSLRYALLAMCPGYVWAAWHLWRSSRYVMNDMGRLHAGVYS